jgi:FKBP-type peptidyl-prolyl cis-trans isomerase (trigger factor)
MPDITREEIERRMDELAREYGRTPPEDQRRPEMFKELTGLKQMKRDLWFQIC